MYKRQVHRFTAVQQDALLPSIENGIITFIGATTENPFFAVNKALINDLDHLLNISKLTKMEKPTVIT